MGNKKPVRSDAGKAGGARRRLELTTNEGGRGVRRQFFPFGNRMGKRSTKGGARRASLVISSESGPNPARTVIYSVRVRAPL